MKLWSIAALLVVALLDGCGSGRETRKDEERPSASTEKRGQRQVAAKGQSATKDSDGWGEDVLVKPPEDQKPTPEKDTVSVPLVPLVQASPEEDWDQGVQKSGKHPSASKPLQKAPGKLEVEEPPAAPTSPPKQLPLPTAQPARSAEATPAPTQAQPPAVEGSAGGGHEPNFLVAVDGGVLVLKGLRAQPAIVLAFDMDLGRFLGWRGLLLGVEFDFFIGQTPFGTSYLMFDGLLGFRARFGPQAVKFLLGLGFGVRYMALTGSSSEGATENPELGFGGDGLAGIEVPVASFMSVLIKANGRYMRDPLTKNGQFSSVFGAGLEFGF